MTTFVNYLYYHDIYGGELDEKTFDKFSAKASAYMEKITFGRVSEHTDDERVMWCCCDLCDSLSALPTAAKRSEKVGAWSVSYADPESISEINCARCACKIWLPADWLYRGISDCK